ncbi:MAG: hypothetical protein KAH11_08350 [Rhodospirillales bacterium]|nr:hypothetical protein [Rhodospirillales bacterium]
MRKHYRPKSTELEVDAIDSVEGNEAKVIEKKRYGEKHKTHGSTMLRGHCVVVLGPKIGQLTYQLTPTGLVMSTDLPFHQIVFSYR